LQFQCRQQAGPAVIRQAVDKRPTIGLRLAIPSSAASFQPRQSRRQASDFARKKAGSHTSGEVGSQGITEYHRVSPTQGVPMPPTERLSGIAPGG